MLPNSNTLSNTLAESNTVIDLSWASCRIAMASCVTWPIISTGHFKIETLAWAHVQLQGYQRRRRHPGQWQKQPAGRHRSQSEPTHAPGTTLVQHLVRSRNQACAGSVHDETHGKRKGSYEHQYPDRQEIRHRWRPQRRCCFG